MRNLDLRKQLKTFGKGMLKAAASSVTGGASFLGANVANSFVQPKVGNLPSITKVPNNKKPTNNPSTGIRATSKKLKGPEATGKKMQKAKKLKKFPVASTNAKPVKAKTIKTNIPSPKINKVKPTANKTVSNKKVKTKVKTNKRGKVKIKTKIKY